MTDLSTKIQVVKYILILVQVMGILSSIIVVASIFGLMNDSDELLDENPIDYHWEDHPSDNVVPSKIHQKSKSFYQIEI